MSEELGVKIKRREDFSKWYLEVVRKGDFIDQRSPLKGFDVIMPWGYSIWETIQHSFDRMIKKHGVRNAYFPLFIPESLLKKEEAHLAGFKAETAMVTEAGGEKLEERLAVRPTSETIMYCMFSLWIRSYKDLPFKINQWCNVVRWDTKVTKPFVRGREFLWQEGHTAHDSKEDADQWIKEVIGMYSSVYSSLAMAPLILVRPKSDTFAGAEYTVVFDTLMQDGKVVQGPGSHMLGQHFSKPFNITFLDKIGKKQHVWQTSWGMTTRQLGMLIMHHGDDRGAVLPPEIAPYQAVIVPILIKGREEEVINYCRKIETKLIKLNIRVHLDSREYSPGFKYNDWELRGVPLRIEIGPNDADAGEITIVRRFDTKKEKLRLSLLRNIVNMLHEIQQNMLHQSEKRLEKSIHNAESITDVARITKTGISRTNWCGSAECEASLKAETNGAEIRGSLWGIKEKPFGKCIHCRKEAKHVVYVARAY